MRLKCLTCDQVIIYQFVFVIFKLLNYAILITAYLISSNNKEIVLRSEARLDKALYQPAIWVIAMHNSELPADI